MGFRVGAFARLWKVEPHEKYTTGQLTVSKKNKETGNYETEFQDGFVRFIGEAHNVVKGLTPDEKKGITVKINDCDVQTKYNPETKTRSISYIVWSCELPDGAPTGGGTAPAKPKGNEGFMNIPDGLPEELPFN